MTAIRVCVSVMLSVVLMFTLMSVVSAEETGVNVAAETIGGTVAAEIQSDNPATGTEENQPLIVAMFSLFALAIANKSGYVGMVVKRLRSTQVIDL